MDQDEMVVLGLVNVDFKIEAKGDGGGVGGHGVLGRV